MDSGVFLNQRSLVFVLLWFCIVLFVLGGGGVPSLSLRK